MCVAFGIWSQFSPHWKDLFLSLNGNFDSSQDSCQSICPEIKILATYGDCSPCLLTHFPVCALTTRSAFFKFDRKYIVHPQASASTRVPFRKPAQSIISCDIFTFKGIDSGPYHNSDLKSMREIQFIWLDLKKKMIEVECYWICYSQSPEGQSLINGTWFCYFQTVMGYQFWCKLFFFSFKSAYLSR